MKSLVIREKLKEISNHYHQGIEYQLVNYKTIYKNCTTLEIWVDYCNSTDSDVYYYLYIELPINKRRRYSFNLTRIKDITCDKKYNVIKIERR
jgi:hypothetical protein